jgi:PAS domain-containing protein
VTMRRECAWCKTSMGVTASQAPSQFPVTHGICDSCAESLEAAISEDAGGGKLRSVLRQVPEPILAFSEGIKVIEGSSQAVALLGVTPETLAGRFPGDAIRCVNAQNAQCGTTPECPSCRLRGTLTVTMRDGVPAQHATSMNQILVDEELLDVTFDFSTERIGAVGLLVIHRVGRAAVK